MSERSDFQQFALFEGKVVASRSNSFNNNILPAQIAQNVNLSDIFSFEFEANESPFLLSNTAVNKQKTITAIGLAGSIITYQLMQQLQRTVDRPAQTVIVIANGIKKTPKTEKALVFEFKEEKKLPVTEIFMALGSPSNWAKETEQKIFKETRGWNVVKYSTPEPRKQPPHILLKCKNCNKKLLSIRTCISPKEEYETHMLPEKCNWIDVAMRGGVCNQTCQYALSISEKVRRGTPFNTAYNSALNKLYHYPYDTEMIFDLTIALINGATQEDVCQMKKAKYIKYIIELAGFDYKDEVETYHQIASYTYPTKEAQIQ
ncbi:hypothetical protein G9A89_018039 [Geosiphon pyriformis]|nr:hypothetical protein G9A89_018039 [Geosiphon pyriformis]